MLWGFIQKMSVKVMKPIVQFRSLATDLSCSKCGKHYAIDRLQSFSSCCEKPLIVNYIIDEAFQRTELAGRENSMWRYAEMLPLFDPSFRVTLGEGMTPILPLKRLSFEYGFDDLWVKDEGLNPTGSFKSRGLSMAISKARELGVTSCVIPTAGNAGGALSAYAAAAGMKATVIMPKETPLIFREECQYYGSELILVDGFIDKCGELAAEIQKKTGAFNIATMKEPYRLEGKKTMGYEIAEQMDWRLPDVILYPTGGGTGLIGIWKAFQEMISLGWIDDAKLPRMVVVQSSNCAPLIDLISGRPVDRTTYKTSIANGLVVPEAFGKDMIRKVIKESKGYALSVSDEQILDGVKEVSSKEGILISPEGAATWVALKDLVAKRIIAKEEKILLLNTGSGYKYLENYR